MATGDTLQRWKDDGVFAYERLGGTHLLVGLNKDAGTTRTITVQTGFGADRELQNLTDDAAPRVRTDAHGSVAITVPKNANGTGYVCYGLPARIEKFAPKPIATTQEYEGASDLDIPPAISGESVQVCRVFAEAHTRMELRLTADTAGWKPQTTVQVTVKGENGSMLGGHSFDQKTNGSPFSVEVAVEQFYALSVEAAETPHPHTSYRLGVTYTAPQKI